MKKFGVILNYFRTKSNISMATLAQDICSKHYIYLIEHEQRTPSIRMIDDLSARLNFDWREYVDFADNPSPIDAKNLMDKFKEFSKNYDYEGLFMLLESLPEEQWLKSYPMDLEIILQKTKIYIYYNKNTHLYDDNIKVFKNEVETLLSDTDYSMLSLLNLRFLHLYSVLLIKEGNIEGAYELMKKLYASVQAKANIARHYKIYIDISHGLIKCYAIKKNYKMMNSLAIKLLSYQEDKCLLSEVPKTLMLIGDSYKYIGKKTLAYRFYKRSATVSKIIKNSFLLEKTEKKIQELY